MKVHNKFLAMEGIDGAGKRTQIELLCKLLDARRVPYQRFSFPRYDSFFGRLVARFLNGEFGRLQDVDAHLSALLYANDRLEAKPALEAGLRAGRVVLTDRYVASNLAHQSARVAPRRRAAFVRWLQQLEYGLYGLPREALVIYLRMPAAVAQRLVERKQGRTYTRRKKDLQEASLRHLADAAKVYDHLARQSHWVTVECFDQRRGRMRGPEEIHREVARKIEARAGFLLQRSKRRNFRRKTS